LGQRFPIFTVQGPMRRVFLEVILITGMRYKLEYIDKKNKKINKNNYRTKKEETDNETM
jgi:hypothetical protein